MRPRDKNKEQTAEIAGVLKRFHSENPDLFVEDISITCVQDGLRRSVLSGLKITITVQPHEAKK